jgi:uncharacterized protein involved in exopolysaccharide biosynthesis
MSDVQISSISPREFAAVLFRQKWAIAAFYAIAVLTVAVYCFFWPPTYEAAVRFVVKNDRQSQVVSADQDDVRMLARQPVTEDELNTEVAILSSNAVIEETAEQVHLDKMPEHWLVRLLNTPIESAWHLYNSYHGRPDRDALAKSSARLRTKLLVDPQKRSDVIEARLQWGSPDVAQNILETLSANYLTHHVDVRKTPESADFFLDQANQKKAQLDLIEAKIQAISPGATPESLRFERELLLQEASEFERNWRKAHAESQQVAAQIQGNDQQLKDVPPRIVTEVKPVINEAALGAIKVQLLEAQRKHRELLQKYKPDQPLVKQSEEDLEQVQSTLAAELGSSATSNTTNVNKVAESLQEGLALNRSQLLGLQSFENALKAEYGEAMKTVSSFSDQTFQLRMLDRERRAAEESYLNYMKHYEEGRIDAAMNHTRFVNVSMIEPVRANPVPVKPNIPLLLKLSLGLGLLLSIGFGFLLEMLDHRLKSKLDAEEFLGLPVMASLDYYPAPTSGRNGNGSKHHEMLID